MSNIKPGLRLSDEHGAMRVMAVAEGYVMLRRPRATPFVRSVKEIEKLLIAGSKPLTEQPEQG